MTDPRIGRHLRRADSWLDLDGIEDRPKFGDRLRRRAGGSFRRDQQASAFDVEDPELLSIAGAGVAVERVSFFRCVDERDPALQPAFVTSDEAAAVPLPFDR